MTVTTGARACSDSDTVIRPGRLPDRPAWRRWRRGLLDHDHGRFWSSTWLMVTIWPSFIRCLMTSAALTDILCARSATLMVSGTWTSRAMNLRRRLVAIVLLLRPPRPPDFRRRGGRRGSAGFLRGVVGPGRDFGRLDGLLRTGRPAWRPSWRRQRRRLPTGRSVPDSGAARRFRLGSAQHCATVQHLAQRFGLGGTALRHWTPPAAWRDACRQDGRRRGGGFSRGALAGSGGGCWPARQRGLRGKDSDL